MSTNPLLAQVPVFLATLVVLLVLLAHQQAVPVVRLDIIYQVVNALHAQAAAKPVMVVLHQVVHHVLMENIFREAPVKVVQIVPRV